VIGNGSTHDYIHRRTDVSVSLCIGDPVEELVDIKSEMLISIERLSAVESFEWE